jgi:hypothetical protein
MTEELAAAKARVQAFREVVQECTINADRLGAEISDLMRAKQDTAQRWLDELEAKEA